jgi:hypothetical protein
MDDYIAQDDCKLECPDTEGGYPVSNDDLLNGVSVRGSFDG